MSLPDRWIFGLILCGAIVGAATSTVFADTRDKPPPHKAEKPPALAETVTISKDAILEIQMIMQKQQAQLEEARNIAMYWHDKNQELIKCLRTAAAENRQTLECIGDKGS